MKEHTHTRKGPVSSCVRIALERYFNDLNGEKPGHLYEMVIGEVERPLLEIVMHQTKSNQCKAAKMLGINRNTLRKKLKIHGLDK